MSKAWLGVLWMSAVLAAPGGGGGSQAEAQPLQQRAAEAGTPSTPTIGERTAGMEKLAGYFNLYWDAKQGKIWLEIDKWGTEFLYQSGLPAGIGSNDIGLDRGQLGATRIVRFDRSGPKVPLIQENLEYRAVSNDPDERRAVHDSFAESALWGLRWRRKKRTVRWWTRRSFSCAMRITFPKLCDAQSKARTGWTARAARFTCQKQRISR